MKLKSSLNITFKLNLALPHYAKQNLQILLNLPLTPRRLLAGDCGAENIVFNLTCTGFTSGSVVIIAHTASLLLGGPAPAQQQHVCSHAGTETL